MQSRQLDAAKVKASAAAVVLFAILSSAALSASIELLLALVVQIQFASIAVFVPAKLAVEAKIKTQAIINCFISFKKWTPKNETVV